MEHRRLGATLIALATSAVFSAAHADSFESLALANALASVLASEEPCGLKYDQAAIAGFIEEKVSADDMGFASQLNIQTIGSKVMIDEMSESQKTAHCAQTKRVAIRYGFIR